MVSIHDGTTVLVIPDTLHRILDDVFGFMFVVLLCLPKVHVFIYIIKTISISFTTMVRLKWLLALIYFIFIIVVYTSKIDALLEAKIIIHKIWYEKLRLYDIPSNPEYKPRNFLFLSMFWVVWEFCEII